MALEPVPNAEKGGKCVPVVGKKCKDQSNQHYSQHTFSTEPSPSPWLQGPFPSDLPLGSNDNTMLSSLPCMPSSPWGQHTQNEPFWGNTSDNNTSTSYHTYQNTQTPWNSEPIEPLHAGADVLSGPLPRTQNPSAEYDNSEDFNPVAKTLLQTVKKSEKARVAKSIKTREQPGDGGRAMKRGKK
ncbi:hypothetical protein H2200_012433 [Cladophialophora chaetospira]|uniref:Uncharacterized protein n=1 Tax=Cladophialophora chaetospira TaxID=386627 RepID=A0AA39CCD8_9EURO|nr:hypothetical protein H2200_012433 [Cladophialophora chaetospira]